MAKRGQARYTREGERASMLPCYGVYLLCFSELFDDFGGHLVVLEEVICNGVTDPRGPLSRPQLQELIPSLLHVKRWQGLEQEIV